MNPAVFAATTAANAAAAQGAAQRARLVKRLEELRPQEATRERVLAGQESLAPLLDRMIRDGVVRRGPGGTLRYDAEAMRARQRRAAKVALLVICGLAAIGAGTALALVLL